MDNEAKLSSSCAERSNWIDKREGPERLYVEPHRPTYFRITTSGIYRHRRIHRRILDKTEQHGTLRRTAQAGLSDLNPAIRCGAGTYVVHGLLADAHAGYGYASDRISISRGGMTSSRESSNGMGPRRYHAALCCRAPSVRRDRDRAELLVWW